MTASTIRFATPADADALAAIYAHYVLNTAITFEYDAPTSAEFGRRIAATGARYPYLVCESGGGVAGYAYAGVFRERAAYRYDIESSIYLAPERRGKGIGRALYRCLEDLLREQGYYNLYAGVTVPNPASFRLHEVIGFTYLGAFPKAGYKFGVWHDVAWFLKALRDYGETPGELKTPRELDPAFVAGVLRRHAEGLG